MAAIQTSVHELGHAQADGSRYVVERHTWDNGRIDEIRYGPVPAGFDYVSTRTGRAAVLAAQLADSEFEALLLRDAFAIEYQTATQFAARFRERYREATREELARLAHWIIRRIVAGQITDAQVRTAFGLTTPQYNSLKTRMQALHDQWAAILAAVGE